MQIMKILIRSRGGCKQEYAFIYNFIFTLNITIFGFNFYMLLDTSGVFICKFKKNDCCGKSGRNTPPPFRATFLQ